jgi:hypothetical protein
MLFVPAMFDFSFLPRIELIHALFFLLDLVKLENELPEVFDIHRMLRERGENS